MNNAQEVIDMFNKTPSSTQGVVEVFLLSEDGYEYGIAKRYALDKKKDYDDGDSENGDTKSTSQWDSLKKCLTEQGFNFKDDKIGEGYDDFLSRMAHIFVAMRHGPNYSNAQYIKTVDDLKRVFYGESDGSEKISELDLRM